MFNNCRSLSEIDFKNVLNKCNANGMFNQCENLRRAFQVFSKTITLHLIIIKHVRNCYL